MASLTNKTETTTRVNKDLLRERNGATFNLTEVTNILDGGPEKTKLRKELERIIFSEPQFQQFWKMAFKSKTELYEDSLAKGLKLVQLYYKHKWTEEEFIFAKGLINHVFPFDLHLTMFIPGIERLATETQKEKWLPLARNFKLLGTYAQTEIGHGTYLPGLETRATYDPVTEEFILNTPSISAMKWWPGALGKTSTHAIVLALLVINGKHCGMQPFMVQLRSLENHMPLPGIEVGDIGPKMSVNFNDNGFLALKNVRIPRENMLMKNAQVSKDGKFKSNGLGKANYATMTYVRVQITSWVYETLKRSITTAIRYSAVRHQSKLSESEPEPQILDYQTQQYKLFPVLANVYALFFMSKRLHRQYNQMMDDITSRGNFRLLPEIHSISCGLKAIATKIGIEGASVCRTSCGGHGYLEVATFSLILGSLHGVYTAEGEYTVVCLQTARYLIKQIANVAAGKMVENSTEYLNADPMSYSCSMQSPEDCLNFKNICDIFKNRANCMVRSVASRLQTEIEAGVPQHIAMNNNLQSLVRIAEAHCQTIMVTDFVAGVSSLRASPGTTSVLTRLCQLFALHIIVENSGDFLETESVGMDQIKWIRDQELKVMAAIRPDAVALVDAFDLHDESIGSLLGGYDGNVYEKLYESTKCNPMNQTQVHPSYHKYLKPLLSGEIPSKL